MKKIYTLGPASLNDHLLTTFIKLLNSADAFRINLSHSSCKELSSSLSWIKNIFETHKKTIPVYLDLQGAKMRIGKYPGTERISDRVFITLSDKSDTLENIPVPHPELFEQIEVGEHLLLNDAKIHLKVINKTPAISTHDKKTTTLECELIESSRIDNTAIPRPLYSNKGINRASHPIKYHKVRENDKAFIEIGNNFPFVKYAFSFVHDGTEADLIRPLIGDKKLTAKIELKEALTINNLLSIDNKFDEMWFCRGDLGAQAGLKNLAGLQREFVSLFPKLSKPKFLAGQVLEHMTSHPTPTRSEVVHLSDIELAGFNGIVLSDETAIGKYIYEVVDFLDYFFPHA